MNYIKLEIQDFNQNFNHLHKVDIFIKVMDRAMHLTRTCI